MRTLAAACCLCAGLALGGLLRAQASAAPILAALEGTRLTPIAQLRAERWTKVTAGALATPPREWTRWTPAGEPAAITLAAPQPSTGCVPPRAFAIATPARRSGSPQYAGLASSGPIAHVAAASVNPANARIRSAITSLFDRRAAEHAVSAAALARVPMTIDVLYTASPAAGSVSYYFEASKRLPDAGGTPDEDPKGIVRIAVSGWLRDSATRLVPAGSKSELSWEPADPQGGLPPALTPLGVVRQGNEAVWVMAGQTGSRRTFTLYAIGSGAVRELMRVEGC